MADSVGALEVEEDGEFGDDVRPPLPKLRLSRRGVAVICLLVAALLGGVVWLVWFSSVFDVRTVGVSGTRVLTDSQVLQAAQVPLGGPLEQLDTGAIESRVEKALPRVDRADVSTSWPHTVRIVVTERVPVASVRVANGGYALEDADGVQFATTAQPLPGVPVVQLALSAAGRGELADFPQAVLVSGAVEVAKSLPVPVARRTQRVVVHSYDDIELTLSSGVTVYWGSPDQSARKAVVLNALMKRTSKGYDVSAPTDPALRS